MPVLDHVLQFLGGGDSSRAATGQASSPENRPHEAREGSPFTRLLGQQNRTAARDQEGPARMLPQPGKASEKGAESGPLPAWPLSVNGTGEGEVSDPELTAAAMEKPAKPGGMLLPPEGEALPQAVRQDADRGESGEGGNSGSPASEALPLAHASLQVLSAAADGRGHWRSSAAGPQSPVDLKGPAQPGATGSGESRQAPGLAGPGQGSAEGELAGRTNPLESGVAVIERTRAQDPTQARAEGRAGAQSLTQAQNLTGQQPATPSESSGSPDGAERREGDGRESLSRYARGLFTSYQPGADGGGDKGSTESSTRTSQEPAAVAAMEATRPERASPRAESLSVRDITGNRETSFTNPTDGALRQYAGNLWRGNEAGPQQSGDSPGWRQNAAGQGSNDASRMVDIQSATQQSGRLQQFIEQWQTQHPNQSAPSPTGGESDKGLNLSARPSDNGGTTLPPAPSRGDGGVSTTASTATPVPGDAGRPAGDALSGSMERLLAQSGGREQWSESISQRVALMTGQRLGSAELQLDPPELGRLTVQIQVSGDQATVNFVSPNAMVRDSLEQSVQRLQELLGEQGLDLADVDVSDQSESGDEQQQEAPSPEAGVAEDGEAASAEPRRLPVSLVDDYA